MEARLTLTDELIRTILPPHERESGGHDHPDVKAWNDIRLEVIRLLPTRNRLAHHPVELKQVVPVFVNPDRTPSTDMESEAISRLMTVSWHESYVSEAERLRGRHDHAKPLTAPDLSSHLVHVEAVIARLKVFRSNIIAKYASDPAGDFDVD